MVFFIAVLVLTPQGSAQVELCVTLKRKPKATMELNCPVTGESKVLAGRGFRHSERNFQFLAITFVINGRRMINMGSGRFQPEQNRPHRGRLQG